MSDRKIIVWFEADDSTAVESIEEFHAVLGAFVEDFADENSLKYHLSIVLDGDDE